MSLKPNTVSQIVNRDDQPVNKANANLHFTKLNAFNCSSQSNYFHDFPMGKLKQKQQSLANNDRTSIIIKQR